MISKTKYLHIKKFKGNLELNKNLFFGNCGLQILSNSILSDIYIDLIKKQFIKSLKKFSKLYFRINWNKILTKKSSESRMGSGKGDFYKKVCIVKYGDILFELKTEITPLVLNFFKVISYKLPIKTQIIYKNVKI
uniref:50S ribosomal protein L16 n=1 Tax=Nephromyces sp. ex Molgula occidentalis TaxID=2544991 RepID=A0A5C1H8D7_9APIC|nr:50S ribosomal protein L16 [Nephromyces sp. ex Molgula occidentalis]